MKTIVTGLAVFLFFMYVSAGAGPDASDPGQLFPGGRLSWGLALDGYPITSGRLKETREETGMAPNIVVFFLAWPERGDIEGEFPEASLDAIHEAGAVPCLTWEPMYFDGGNETSISAEAILTGEYDEFLSSFARAAARWNRPFIIRFAHEMNLSRYHWGTPKENYGPDSPGLYRRMFGYVVQRFREEGADNVLWAFCPNAESVPQEEWNVISAYYPGDDFVDMLGIDGYNWGFTRTAELHGWDSRWQDFPEIFYNAHKELRGINPDKPLLIFETASVDSNGCQKNWLVKALGKSRKWGVKGIVWFQADKENDWRLSAESVRALKKAFAEKDAERGNHGKK